MDIKMKNENILVEPINNETTTKSGIILAGEPTKTNKAVIKAVADGSEYCEGDTILYDKFNVTAISETLAVIKECDVIGVCND